MDKKNGFTLIEIMVVIVIMGVLAAVAVPKLFGMMAKAKASELLSAVGTYIHLQEAHLHQEHGIGSWKDIGYQAPGNGRTSNFVYGDCLQGESSEEGSSTFIGWHATNLSSLNECSASNSWGLVIAPVSKELAYYSRVVSSTECAAFAGNWNVGDIDVGGCTAEAMQTAQASTNSATDSGDTSGEGNVTGGDDSSGENTDCERKGNGKGYLNSGAFVDVGDGYLVQPGQAKKCKSN